MKQAREIPLPLAFDFKRNLDYLRRRSNEVMYQLVDERIYRAYALAAGVALISMAYGDRHQLVLRIENEVEATPAEWAELIAEIEEFFDLGRNVTPFYELAAQDPILSGLETTQFGLRLIGVPNFFEAMAWGILGQQINLAFAYTLKRRLVETYGQPLHIGAETYWLFPTPEVIASVSVAALQRLQLSQRKAEYLIQVANLLASGKISKAQYLALASPNEIEQALTQIRGIGPWTANYVMMRCLRVPSAFPARDVGLLNALKVRQGLAEQPAQEEVAALKEKWGPWASYAVFYLWHTLY